MSGVLGASYWQVFSAPWRQRKTQKAYGFLLTVTVLLIGCWGAVAVISGFDRQPMMFAFAVLTIVGLEILWIRQLVAYLQYNRPVCVLTVPGYLVVQRRTLLATWCAVVGLQAVAFIVSRELGVDRLTPSNLLIVLALAGVSLFFPLFWRWPIVFGVATGTCAIWLHSLQNWLVMHWPAAKRWELWDDYGVWLTLAALPAMAWLLTKVMRSGNAAHRAAYKGLHTIQMLNSPNANGNATKLPSVTGGFYRDIFNWHANRILTRGSNRSYPPLARAELALGPGWLWWNLVATAIVLASIFGICLLFLNVLWGRDGEFIGRIVFSSQITPMLVAVLAWAPLQLLPLLLTLTHREQTLIVLLPGIPTGNALARQLAVRLVRRAAVTWLCMALVLWSLPLEKVAQPLGIALCLITLQVIPFMIRDGSRMSRNFPPRGSTRFAPVLCISAAYGLAPLLYNAIFPTTLAVTVALVCFIAHFAWRWHRLAGYPQPLPVGRSARQQSPHSKQRK